MNIFDRKANTKIKSFIMSDLHKIDVNSGSCRFNFRCHLNAVHDAINNNDDKIAMCFYITENDNIIIHFLNVNEKGEYIDNTLGHWSKINTYYLIRHIDKKDFFNVSDIFISYRKELKDKLPFLTKTLSQIEF